MKKSRAIICLEAAGYKEQTAKEMLKGKGRELDISELPDHVHDAIVYGEQELDWLMREAKEEFGF